MRQRLCSLNDLNVEKEVITNRNPLGSHAVRQAVTEKPQGPRAVVRLCVHRGLGLEKQLDHLRVAVSHRKVQRCPTSIRSPSSGRSSGSPDAPSHKMIETVHPGIYPSKLGTKLLESMFVFEGLFHVPYMFDLIWDGLAKAHVFYHCISSLPHLFHHLQYSSLIRHTDAACREGRFKTL